MKAELATRKDGGPGRTEGMRPFLEADGRQTSRSPVPGRQQGVRSRYFARFRKPKECGPGRKIAVRPRRPGDRTDIPASIFEAWKNGRPRPCARDLVSPLAVSPQSRLLVFLLDVSDSMAGTLDWMRAWMRAAMERAYLRRDPVSVIIVQGREARILVHPTTSLGFALHRLSRVRVGGATPLDRGIIALNRLARQYRDTYPVIDICLLTDARSTSPLDTAEVLACARRISCMARQIRILNPGSGSDRRMQELAALLNAAVIDDSGKQETGC